jgi:hypothetical protein
MLIKWVCIPYHIPCAPNSDDYCTDRYLKHYQRFRLRDEGGSQSLSKPVQLHRRCLDSRLHCWTMGMLLPWPLMHSLTHTHSTQPSNFILTRVRAHSKLNSLPEYFYSKVQRLTEFPFFSLDPLPRSWLDNFHICPCRCKDLPPNACSSIRRWSL